MQVRMCIILLCLGHVIISSVYSLPDQDEYSSTFGRNIQTIDIRVPVNGNLESEIVPFSVELELVTTRYSVLIDPAEAFVHIIG